MSAASCATRCSGGESADIDLATPALPEEIIAALEKAGIKAVPTGIAHGTVTAVVPPRHFEITTLRRDVETYGRRARVAFDADWSEDAARRDFTINALYLDPDGTVYDPVGGLADLAAHRIRFVGEPAKRIAEDVLRVLRYYRFEARFGRGEGDAAARAACRDAVPLLPTLSAERVAQEVLRLLAVADPVPALRMMREDGVLAAILPEATRLDRLERLIRLEPASDPVLRLAALVDVDRAGATRLAERLRLSNAMRDRLVGLAPPWALDPAGDRKEQRRALYRLGRERYRDLALLLAAEGRLDREVLARAAGARRRVGHAAIPDRRARRDGDGDTARPPDRPTARRSALLVGRGRFPRRPRRLPRAARRADRAGAGPCGWPRRY